MNGREAVARQPPAGVGVNHEHGAAGAGEKNGGGGPGADAAQAEELFAQLCGRAGEEAGERAAVAVVEMREEAADRAGLLSVVPGGAQESRHSSGAEAGESRRSQRADAAEVPERLLDVRPIGILRQQRAQDDFEGRARRPPVPVAVVSPQPAVVARERSACLGPVWRFRHTPKIDAPSAQVKAGSYGEAVLSALRE